MANVMVRTAIGSNELWWLSEGPGGHGDKPQRPSEVVQSLDGCFRFAKESSSSKGLRTPQIGALHAILAHRTTQAAEPITVVMPTGTGKTETMLSVFCNSPQPTLVVVPSDALRSQIAEKFATLGVLPSAEVVVGDFLCPSVVTIKGALGTVHQVDELLNVASVLVATVQSLAQSTDTARERLAEKCDRLFVDEAHHVPAKTWRAVADLFEGKQVVQFTATPYREDGQHLSGRIVYAYPLRLAQENGYFAPIKYHSVVEPADQDRAIAIAAVQRLRDDLAAGYNHILMARVSSVDRAKDVIRLYEALAPDLVPLRIDTGFAESTRLKHRDMLLKRNCRIVVCVNMLGEGFDLPALKVAAIHDPHKSLAATLQFVGRFTRSGDESLGEASAFVPLQATGIDDRLRRLYGEDSDWNEVIRDLTEHAVGKEKERSVSRRVSRLFHTRSPCEAFTRR